MRTSTLIGALSAVAVASAGVMALDIGDELRMGWKMGLLPRQDSQNLQTFDGDVGGVKASAITKSSNPERPFEVDGDTFPDFTTAANRACDNQKNKCSQAANNGPQKFEVSECDKQSGKLPSCEPRGRPLSSFADFLPLESTGRWTDVFGQGDEKFGLLT
ncbi:neurofilament medium polypeptide protein [Colletotrichum tofieldiae]|nr:neurofilament medium polypeptide protein [Colletotrichum tofieldiae]